MLITRTNIPRNLSGIYQILSKINGKIYVGSAVHLFLRKSKHFNALKINKHCNYRLQQHVDYYGIEDLLFGIIEYCALDKLIEREQYWMDKLQPEFNICPYASSCLGVKHTEETKEKKRGVNGYWYGKHLPEETREKIRILATGRLHTEATKLKIGALKKGNTNKRGKPASEETKRNIGLSKKGTVHTEETKKKMSEAHKNLIRSEEHKRNISKGKKGKPNNRKGATQTEEAKLKMSIAKKGHLTSEETRRKISQTKRGVPTSEENKAKIGAGVQAMWDRKKQRY